MIPWEPAAEVTQYIDAGRHPSDIAACIAGELLALPMAGDDPLLRDLIRDLEDLASDGPDATLEAADELLARVWDWADGSGVLLA